ncbi:protein kinase [bacterium]|nr:protein kinase [bacterium]
MIGKAALILAMTLSIAPVALTAAGAMAPAWAAQEVTGDRAWVYAMQAVDDLIAQGRPEAAIAQLEALLKAAPKVRAGEAHLRLASLYGRLGRYDAAISHGNDAIEAWPENGWNYLPVARVLALAGRPAAAIALCTEAIKRDPAVRLAAQDLIFQIQSGALKPETTASPTPSPAPPVAPAVPTSLYVALGSLLTLSAGALAFGFSRRKRPVPPAPPQAPVSERAEQTGPVTYGPLGVRMREAGEMVGSYRILRVVGSSLHSILYCAEDTRLGRQVALKQVASGAGTLDGIISRFQKEVQSLIALSNHHDGVVKVYDYMEPSMLVTEWIEGENLEEAAPLPLEQVLSVGIAICDVLAFAHARGIVHRDIKPSNIMRTQHTGHVKLLDFGIAKNAALGTSNLTLDANVPIGTFTYMPPEQFAAPNQAKAPSDLYSLGLTLYRLITGEMPTEPWLGPRTFGLIPTEHFRPLTAESRAIALTLAATPALSEDLGWVAGLDAIIRRAFEENPADRYPDALSFKRALEGVWHRVVARSLA